MDSLLLSIIVLSIVIPVAGIISGFFMRFHASAPAREKGTRRLQWGMISLAAVILIGYAICSNFKLDTR